MFARWSYRRSILVFIKNYLLAGLFFWPPCQKQYFYPLMLHLFAYLNMLICLFLFGNIQHPDHVRDNNFCVWTLILQVDLSKESLLKQFQIVKRETNTSHVEKYGDMVSTQIFTFVRQTIYTLIIISFKPSVSHWDRMNRYDTPVEVSSESNCWWKTVWLKGCHNCVHIDVQSLAIEKVHGSSLLLIYKNIQCTLKGESHFFFRRCLRLYSRYLLNN